MRESEDIAKGDLMGTKMTSSDPLRASSLTEGELSSLDLDLDSIFAPVLDEKQVEAHVPVAAAEGDFYDSEKTRLTLRRLQGELDLQRAYVDGFRQDIDERKRYATRIFVLVCCWLAAVFFVIVASATHLSIQSTGARLRISTLWVLLSGVTFLVASMLFVVCRGGKLRDKAAIKRRKEHVWRIFGYVKIWMWALVLGIIFSLPSWSVSVPKFNLSDGVLIALISGTTIEVIALFGIVARYLFPNQSHSDLVVPTKNNSSTPG